MGAGTVDCELLKVCKIKRPVLHRYNNQQEVEMEDIFVERFVDINISDTKNPLAIVEYVEDLYAHYRKMEIKRCGEMARKLRFFKDQCQSRPDLLDAALLRPGRLDRLLLCDFPSLQERLDILTVLFRKLPLVKDVKLEAIAGKMEGFSGSDLQALLSDAQLASVHDLLNNKDADRPGNMISVVTNALLQTIVANARLSVSEDEKHRLYNIYGQRPAARVYVLWFQPLLFTCLDYYTPR